MLLSMWFLIASRQATVSVPRVRLDLASGSPDGVMEAKEEKEAPASRQPTAGASAGAASTCVCCQVDDAAGDDLCGDLSLSLSLSLGRL